MAQALPQALTQALPQALIQALPLALAPLRIDIARSFNASATLPEHALTPVPNAAGAAPPATFPAYIRELYDDLTEADVNELLAFYGLDSEGTLSEKLNRFAQHIGIRFEV